MKKKHVNPYSAPAPDTKPQLQNRDLKDEEDVDWFWPIWIFGVVISIIFVLTMVFLLGA